MWDSACLATLGSALDTSPPIPISVPQCNATQVAQIHRQLPPGGILVFLTGQAEVKQLCKQLESTFKARRRNQPASPASAPPEEAGDVVSGGDAAEEGFGADAIDFLDAEAEDLDDFDDGEGELDYFHGGALGGTGYGVGLALHTAMALFQGV